MPPLYPFTLADYLRAIADPLPSVLITAADLAEIYPVLDRFPAHLADTLYLEVRLGRADAPVDIAFSVRASAQRVLHEVMQHADLPDHAVWSGLHTFAAAWSDSSALLSRSVGALWLEFDLPTATPVPILFIDLQPPIRSAVDYEQIARDVLPRMIGEAVPDAIMEQMKYAIVQMTEPLAVHLLGSMRARGTPSQRLALITPNTDQVIPYLHQIGWSRSTAPLEILLTLAAQSGAYCVTNLDFALDGLLPKVGVECFLRDQGQRDIFLDGLLAQGLCLPERAAALREFGAVSTAFQTPSHPAPLYEATRILNGIAISQIVWEVSHIKVTCEWYGDVHRVEAKAYLRARREWRTRSGSHFNAVEIIDNYRKSEPAR